MHLHLQTKTKIDEKGERWADEERHQALTTLDAGAGVFTPVKC